MRLCVEGRGWWNQVGLPKPQTGGDPSVQGNIAKTVSLLQSFSQPPHLASLKHIVPLGSATGHMMAELIVDGKSSTLDVAPFRLSRFAEGTLFRMTYGGNRG